MQNRRKPKLLLFMVTEMMTKMMAKTLSKNIEVLKGMVYEHVLQILDITYAMTWI